jgi:hypothetical protein
MALILRIDVDRPYGKTGILRHALSRISSDLYFPRVASLDYLGELKILLRILNRRHISAYVFYRRCTLPSPEVIGLIADGRHESGLHLENSRSYQTFQAERFYLERHLHKRIAVFTKHGSGKHRYGWHHYYPYEPENYLAWAKQAKMKAFFGNEEDPTIEPVKNCSITFFPSAFWLEPHWRDTKQYTIDWLITHATQRDVVMLLHPDNILASRDLMQAFMIVLNNVQTTLL